MKRIFFCLLYFILGISMEIYSKEKEAWQIAYQNDDPSYLKYLKKPVNNKDLNDRTQLHYAAEKGKYNIAKALIEKGADVNSKDNISWTPLHHAAYGGQTKTAALLIEHGAEVNAKGGESSISGEPYNYTPLHYATMRGNFETVKLLVEHGADVNAENNEGVTPLCFASEYGNIEMVKILITGGAKVNVKIKRTPLHRAISATQQENARILIEKGADLYAKNDRGETALDFAENTHREWAIKFLWPYYHSGKEYKSRSK